MQQSPWKEKTSSRPRNKVNERALPAYILSQSATTPKLHQGFPVASLVTSINMAKPYPKTCKTQTLSTARPGVQHTPDYQYLHAQIALVGPYKTYCQLSPPGYSPKQTTNDWLPVPLQLDTWVGAIFLLWVSILPVSACAHFKASFRVGTSPSNTHSTV